jgi:hypothetical protein
LDCLKTFSKATFDSCYRQKKRQKNLPLARLLASGCTKRRSARLLQISRKTVARKLRFLGGIASFDLAVQTAQSKVMEMEFDDLETFEHTKCKPVSITLAVEAKTRRILGFRVARFAAKGLLAKKARKKYGYRQDERFQRRKELFLELAPIVQDGAIIRSDSNPYYKSDVRKHFPRAHHITVLGARGSTTGQGELKKIGFDPLFSLNHTCAMLRANISRLFRKTWNTTKNVDRLADHVALYAVYHNENLI